MRSGRTTEEVEATYCSTVAGREGRGEMICGCKKRKRRIWKCWLRECGNKSVQCNRRTSINTAVCTGYTGRYTCFMADRKQPRQRALLFFIIAMLRGDYLSYSMPTMNN